MSRQNKQKQTAAGKTVSVNASPERLESRVRQEIAASQYKVAIQRLKLLAKQDGCYDWAQSLFREAYTGRAEQLASQGMMKEAAAIWEVAIPHGLDPADSRYIGWLAQTKQYPQLLDIYRKIPVENRRVLQPRLAAALLSGPAASLLSALPDDDPLRMGYEPARQLLAGWCAGENSEQLHERMKAITFRSPYRDLRQVIQAWLLLENAPEQAGDSLAHIAPDSPFRPLAEQALLAQSPLLEILPQLSALPPSARACQLEARCLADSVFANLLKDFAGLPEAPTAEQLFAFLARVKPAQLPPVARRWWRDTTKRAFVVAQEASSKQIPNRLLTKTVGELSALEGYHIDALSGIATKNLPLEVLSVIWGNYRDQLLSRPDAAPVTHCDDIPPADRYLAVAKINDYLASLWEQEQGKMTDKSLILLIQSLQYDPDDQKVWEKVISYYLQKGDLAAARDTLNEALAHHPNDTALLELGVHIAVEGNSFKKAAGYAKRILEIDPINSRVRQYLQNAHISHARKQIKQKKWHLAHKELAEARLWKSTPLNGAVIQILQTCLAHQDRQGVENDPSQQNSAISATLPQLLADSGLHPAALDFLIRHESPLTGLPERALRQLFPVADPWKKPDKQVVMALLDIAGQLLKVSPESLKAPLRDLRGPLRKASRLPFTAAEGEQLCEFWVQAKEDVLLMHYAQHLQKAWPKKPIFTYYNYYHLDSFADEAVPALDKAMKMAKSQGDTVLEQRISVLLNRYLRPIFNEDNAFDDNFDDNFDDDNGDYTDAGLNKLMQEGDPFEAIRKMAGITQIAPYKDIFELLCELVGKILANSVQKQFGKQTVRDMCQAVLRGADPHEFLAGLTGGPDQKKPGQRRLF